MRGSGAGCRWLCRDVTRWFPPASRSPSRSRGWRSRCRHSPLGLPLGSPRASPGTPGRGWSRRCP
eukprot:12180578-Heterocapsa_arctica.AAC.1